MKRKFDFAIFLLSLLLAGSLGAQSVSELKSQLNRSQSKSERMNLNFQIAKKLLATSPGEAADYANRAGMLAKELEDKRVEADATYLSAEGLYLKRNYKEAAIRFNDAWNTARNYGLYDNALNAMGRLQDIALKQKDLTEALKWSQETVNYLKNNTGRSSSSGDALKRLENKLAAVEADNHALREKIAQLTGQSQNLETNYQEQIKQVETQTQAELSKREVTISQISQEKSRADSLVKTKARMLETMTAEQMADRLMLTQRENEIEVQKAEAKLLQQKSDATRNVLLLVSGFVLLLAAIFFQRYRAKRRTANQLVAQNKIIEAEQKRSDELLLNILPPAIAQELKTKNKVAARKHEQATVMFVDFTGFTRLSEILSPEDLVTELDFCFTRFDRIIGKYHIEKIKTVGDAYICATGLSEKNASPADMVKAALEIQDFLQELKVQHLNQGLPFFEARVGIHTGPVVAGVVGEKKFAYDIWGDTVNISARMEETCEPGRVNVSEATYWLSKYEFEWQDRGKIAAKNKAAMEMYYVTGIKTGGY